MSMDKNGTKFLVVALAATVVMMILSLTTFNDSGTIPVLAQKPRSKKKGLMKIVLNL
jgi:hypothetical protein